MSLTAQNLSNAKSLVCLTVHIKVRHDRVTAQRRSQNISGVYVAAAGIAKVLFFIFLVLFIVSLVGGGLPVP
jgi:hypothetical protein